MRAISVKTCYGHGGAYMTGVLFEAFEAAIASEIFETF